MAIRANRQALLCTLRGAPTRHWGATLSRAEYIITRGMVCQTKDWMIIDDTAWRDAMRELHTLPYGGRHVWKARAELWRGIEQAVR